MSVKEKINNLLLRMAQDDFNFSKEDVYLLSVTPELQDVFLKRILKGPIKVTNLKYDYPLGMALQRDLSHDEIQIIVYNSIYIAIMNNVSIDTDVIGNLQEFFSLERSTIEKINQLIEDRIKNKEYNPEELTVNNKYIQMCLDSKNYELLMHSKFTDNDVLNKETIERMINEFPFNEYGIPEFFENEFYTLYPLEKASIELLLRLWKDSFSIFNPYPEPIMQKGSEALIKRIKESKDLSYLNNNKNLLNFFDNVDYETLKMLRQAAYERGYLPAYTSNYQSKKEFQDRVIELIKEDKLLPDELFIDEIIDLSNPLIIRYAIKHGIIQSIIENNKGEYLKPYEDEIVTEIKTNPSFTKDFKTIKTEKIFAFPKLFQALIENHIIKEINLIELTPEIEEEVYKAVQIDPSLIVYQIEFYKIRKVDIICQQIKNKNRYNYFWQDHDFFKNLTPEEWDRVFEALEITFEDLYEATKFTDNIYFFKNYPRLFDLYFGKELLTEHILNFINHNEIFSDIYDMSVYAKIRDYLIKKYNFNEKSLDMLVNKAGPNIIRYIENESIQKILTISYEEAEKILNLFPEVDYTMNDVNASYDSLIQFMFGKENPDIVSIFPSFLHAIEDREQKAIYHFKQILIINTKKETFLKIKEKYKLEKIKDMNDLLNSIIHGVKGSDSEFYINILHDLTDEYILNERKNYRNNRYFFQLHPEYKEVFNKLLHQIYSGEDISAFIDSIKPYFKRLYNAISYRLPKNEDLMEPTALMQFVAAKVKDPDTRTEYLPILKEIVDSCIECEKADHTRELSIANELKIPYELDNKSTDTTLTTYIIGHIKIFEAEKDGMKHDFIDILQSKLVDIPIQVLHDCCDYVAGKRDDLQTDETTIKQIIPNIIKAIKIIKKEYLIKIKPNAILFSDIPSLIKILDSQYLIKRNYKNPTSNIDLCQILIGLDINIIRKNILNNEELYNKLLEIMTKKKLHLLPDELKKLIKATGISEDYTNVAGFITFFKAIFESEKARLAANGKNPDDALTGLAGILVYAEIYSAISSVYSQILGPEDSKLIKANPKPNDATTKTENNGRLKEAVQLTKTLFERRKITIPTFDKDFEVAENKKLNVIVGNFTAPCNLTHGERTGACMRIGGVGETLFYFCLKNPNGFHIRFEDPETHEYISRVSGFRNGNTVFLNELRNSCNPEKYSDEEIIEACRLAAEELIELSKDSPCPIENVVIAKDYAMLKSPLQQTDLGVESTKQGLPKFYSDVDKHAVVLATTTPPFKKINFSKAKIPTYEPCRGKIKKPKDKKELSSLINRVVAVRQLLKGVPYEEISRLEFKKGLLYGIVADDWYIYVNRNKEIKYECLNVDPRAKEELSKYILVVEELLQNNEIVEEEEYGL